MDRAQRIPLVCAVTTVVALFALGCAGTVTVVAHQEEPARLAITVFPRIWLVYDPLDENERVARALSRFLQQKGKNVETMDADELAARRASHSVPISATVLHLRFWFVDSVHTEWTHDPSTSCGPGGCYGPQGPAMYDVPHVEARMALRVEEGDTGRVLDRAVVRRSRTADAYEALHDELVREFIRVAKRLVIPQSAELEFELVETSEANVTRAIRDAEHGHWEKARERLERYRRSSAFNHLDRKTRAAVLYDLAQVARFDDNGRAVPERLDQAEADLRAAIALQPDELYTTALADIHRQRQAHRARAAEQAAEAHNRALSSGP